jgi:hypothetical protein
LKPEWWCSPLAGEALEKRKLMVTEHNAIEIIIIIIRLDDKLTAATITIQIKTFLTPAWLQSKKDPPS